MNFNEFNRKYPEACDEIYGVLGDKHVYDRDDALVMMNEAIPIFAKKFGISDEMIEHNSTNIESLIEEYLEPFVKVNKFDGILMALCFALIEGSGKEEKGFGRRMMMCSLSQGGINTSLKNI